MWTPTQVSIKMTTKSIGQKGPNALLYLFVQSVLGFSVPEMDHTCHILKSECGWGIAPWVTLLVSDPGFI